MKSLDYLSVLNNDIKKRLWGLFLDRKLVEDLNEGEKTFYDKNKIDDKRDEEMEVSEKMPN